jgi:hypothetical protein
VLPHAKAGPWKQVVSEGFVQVGSRLSYPVSMQPSGCIGLASRIVFKIDKTDDTYHDWEVPGNDLTTHT